MCRDSLPRLCDKQKADVINSFNGLIVLLPSVMMMIIIIIIMIIMMIRTDCRGDLNPFYKRRKGKQNDAHPVSWLLSWLHYDKDLVDLPPSPSSSSDYYNAAFFSEKHLME